jgi:hypothetical protein
MVRSSSWTGRPTSAQDASHDGGADAAADSQEHDAVELDGARRVAGRQRSEVLHLRGGAELARQVLSDGGYRQVGGPAAPRGD